MTSIAAAATTAFTLPGAWAATPANGFRAGAGRADVVFDAAGFPLDGFAAQHDPLAVRVLLLEGPQQRIAIVLIDTTSLSAPVIERMKAILTQLAAVPAEQVLICVSHTFSAPHLFTADHTPPGTDVARSQAALLSVETALRAATAQALASLQPARLGFGNGISKIGVNRDVETPHGWWLGSNDGGYTDPGVGVTRIDRLNGQPLAILMNVAVQPSVMDASERAQGGRLISADLAGAAARHVEQAHGGNAVAMFLPGAGGDQSPVLQAARHVVSEDGSASRVDVHEAGFVLVDLLGEKLGREVLRVSTAITSAPAATLALRRFSIELEAQTNAQRAGAARGPVASFAYQSAGKSGMPVVLLQIGGMVMVGVQPELAASIGARIKAGSPYRHTLVATMVDGAAKYMPDRQSYARYTYEARSSSYAAGAAETAADAILAGLKQFNQDHPSE